MRGVAHRAEAIRRGWLHRVATIVRRDAEGCFLVHRRRDHSTRLPRQCNWTRCGAGAVGESYEAAAAREFEEELGVRAAPRLVLPILCAGATSPYWLALQEARITTPARPGSG